jgi:hypothetical protein
MQRRAAVAAEFKPFTLKAQPMATRRAGRIQTLHRPSGQIFHRSPSLVPDFFGRGDVLDPPVASRKDGGIVREGFLCVKKKSYY